MRPLAALLLLCLSSRVDAACPLFADHFEAAPTETGAVTLDTSGGYRIVIDRHTITIFDPTRLNKVEHWGEAHENLNGKHIKDWGGAPGWDGARRTLELDDGTKVTMEAGAPGGVTERTAVFDGSRYLQFDNCRNVVAFRIDDAAEAARRDAAQHDGEIARFTTNATTRVATYENLGNENPRFEFTPGLRALGVTGGTANPNQVNDFFDDPRLGHT